MNHRAAPSLAEAHVHVGYRVHAHLYCLSRATPSYLLYEDTRGIGVGETLGHLGGDAAVGVRSSRTERLYGVAPRLGSDKTPFTRFFGFHVGRVTLMPDMSGMLLDQMQADRAAGFPRHAAAKAKIRTTLPVMVEMLESLP